MPETRSLCSGPTSAARSALQDVVLGGLGGDPLVACLKGEALAMVDDPEVQVELGAAGEGVEYALLPDHLRYRTVAVLVPVPQDFLGRDVAPPELGEPEAVRLDVGRELPVVRDVGELDLDLRQHPVEGQSLQEVTVLQFVEQVAGRQRRVQGDSAAELYHLGVDYLHAPLAGDGDPVVAILYEVDVPNLVQADRGQLFAPVHDLVYAPPAGPEVGLGGHERPVEVPVTSDAADYLRDGHLPHPQVDL